MLKWFHNLKVAQKLALISFIFVIPDSLMLYLFITSINETIQFARLEQVGTEYQRPLETLLDLLPQQRLEARRSGGRDPGERFASRSRDIDAAFVYVDVIDARIGSKLGFTPDGLARRHREGCDVASVKAEWERIKSEITHDVPDTVRDAQYLTLIDHIRSMIAHAGDMSNLILDPDLDSYYLMDVTLMALPQTQDRLSRVMADGEDHFHAQGDAIARSKVVLATDLAFLKTDDLDRISSSIETTLTSGNPLYGAHPTLHARLPVAHQNYVGAASRFNDLTARLQEDGTDAVELEEFLEAGDAARTAAVQFWSVADEELRSLLQCRIDYYTARRARSLAVAAGALVAAVSLVTFITRSISGPLKRQAQQLKATNDELSRARAQLEARVVQTDAALERTEEKYRKIFENAVMGIFQMSPDGRFRSANPALAVIFGSASPESLVNNDADANRRLYVDAHRQERFERLFREHGYVTDFQSEIRRADGVRWVSENAREVRDAAGELLYYEGTIEDITQRKRAEAEERRAQANAETARAAAEVARAAAESASTAKSDFLATMSHEIRTPLNGVIGIADLLAHTPLSAQQSRYVKIIQSSSDGLMSIINQVLDFSKIEAGKLELAERDFNLPSIVEEVVVVLAQKAAAKGLELACRIDPGVPTRVCGDDDRLRQVLMNIVNNAIKFTARGEVVVRVSASCDEAPAAGLEHRPVTLRFNISDTGSGIPAERMGRLFKSFSQVDSSVTRQHGGTGLGLAISKQLVELMNGDIGVESTFGRGSTFWFTVRVGIQQAATCDVAPFDLTDRRILIVDDNATQCQVLREQLLTWGVAATYATSARVAVNMLETESRAGRPFDLAIVDINMPDVDGLQLARSIRASVVLADLPLILMSGIDASAVAEESGLGQFLTKPIRQSSLLDAVMKALARSTPHAPAATQLPEISEGAEIAEVVPAKGTRILLAEDAEVNQFVVTETLARHGYKCDVVNNGREAVAATAARDYDVILMDCQMPEMSGFEATAAIRAAEAQRTTGTRPVSIIALTANAIKGDRERCLSVGMNDYLTKPLNPARLIASIESHVTQTGDAENAPSTNALPPKAPQPVSAGQTSIDYAELLARCDGDTVMLARLVQKFNHKSALMREELQASCAAGDAPAVARVAHALKGTASNLSAVKVTELAARLEELGRSAELDSAERLVRELGVELQGCMDAFQKLSAESQSTDASASGIEGL